MTSVDSLHTHTQTPPSRNDVQKRHSRAKPRKATPAQNEDGYARNRSELTITEIELRLMAALARMGSRNPNAASGIANTL